MRFRLIEDQHGLWPVRVMRAFKCRYGYAIRMGDQIVLFG